MVGESMKIAKKGGDFMDSFGSREVARCAIQMSLTKNREEENRLKEELLKSGIYTAAVDFGGEFISSINKIIERTVVAAKREGVISDSHAEEGAVAGAAREAISQVMLKAVGLNVGGK